MQLLETGSGDFDSELVGQALAPLRDRVVIATKFAQDIDPAERKPSGRMLRPGEVARAADGSLQRLGVEAIDLYYQHRVNPDIPAEEYAGAVKGLIEASMVTVSKREHEKWDRRKSLILASESVHANGILTVYTLDNRKRTR